MNRWVVSLPGVVGWGSPHFLFWGKGDGSVDAIRGLNLIDTSLSDVTMTIRWADGYLVNLYAG